jgi:hypothetical protein
MGSPISYLRKKKERGERKKIKEAQGNLNYKYATFYNLSWIFLIKIYRFLG